MATCCIKDRSPQRLIAQPAKHLSGAHPPSGWRKLYAGGPQTSKSGHPKVLGIHPGFCHSVISQPQKQLGNSSTKNRCTPGIEHKEWVHSGVSNTKDRCTPGSRTRRIGALRGLEREGSVHSGVSNAKDRCTLGSRTRRIGALQGLEREGSVHPRCPGARFRWTGWQRDARKPRPGEA